MCIIISSVYFSLFIVFIVDSNNIPLEYSLIENDILSKHHHKTRAIENDTESEISSNNNTKSISKFNNDPTNEIKVKDSENSIKYDRTGNSEQVATENATEEKFGKSGEVPKTIFVGNLARTVKEKNKEHKDEYDSHNSDKEISKSGSADIDSVPDDGGDGEVLIHTPTRKSLSQDVVLDLKARTGHIDEEDNYNVDSNLSETSKIEHLSDHNDNLRTGVPDNIDGDLPPDYDIKNEPTPLQKDLYSSKWSNFPHSSDHKAQLHWPNYARPPNNYISHTNSHPRFLPPPFDGISSQEMLHPISIQSSRELRGHNNLRNQPKTSHSGLNAFLQPHNQVYNHRSPIQPCLTCPQAWLPSHKRNFSRTNLENINYLQTSNGRSAEFDPFGANAYPLVKDEYAEESEKVNRVQSAQANQYLSPGSREVQATQESNTETGLFSKVLLQMPPFPRNNPTILQRIALGVPRFVL